MKKTIELIVPCLNEEACIEPFYRAIKELFQTELRDYDFIISYIDDGSRDRTLDEMKRIASIEEPGRIRYSSFSRNFGKEAALYLGLSQSTGDYVVPIDADLQHPPALLPEMVRGIEEEGYDCVAARRVSHKGEKSIRSAGSYVFYTLLNAITSVHMEPGTTDYQMMTRMVVDAIVSLEERERFTKGIYSWIGFKTKWIEYENVKREAGESKWSVHGLFRYAINGFFAFAVRPLRIIIYLGMIITLFAVIYGIRVFANAISHPESAGNGFTTIIVLIIFFGGLLTMLIGMVGEYMARIYNEVKHRPIYIVRESNVRDEDE